MKLSLLNLFFAIVAICAVVVWQVERAIFYERANEIEAAQRVLARQRMQLFFTDGLEEVRVLDRIFEREDQAETLLQLLTVFKFRDSKGDQALMSVFAKQAMTELGCETPSDLRKFIIDSKLDLGLILDQNHPDHKDFNKFIDSSMKVLER